MTDLVQRLRDEADLCRAETANDIARLLDEAADALQAPAPAHQPEGTEPVGWGGVIDRCAELCDPNFIGMEDLDELKRYAGNWNSTYRFFPIYAPGTQAPAVGAEPVGHVTSFGDLGCTCDYVSPQKYRPPVGAPLYAAPPNHTAAMTAAARVTVTDAGWAQLRVFGTVVRGEYGQDGFDILTALASEINSEAAAASHVPVQGTQP